MEKQVVGFKIVDNLYCIDIENVKEVVKVKEITPLPHSPVFVKGIINLRGIIIPIISLRLKFGFEEKKSNEEYKVIIVKIDNLLVGLIVDEFLYVFSFSNDKVQGIDETKDSKLSLNLISGIIRHDKNIFSIVNIKNLLDIEEQKFITKEVTETKNINQ